MATFKLEKQYGENLKTHYTNCIGIDEVGRGCLAGPVVACACIIKNDIELSILHKIKDSKKITPKNRKIIAQEILPHVFYGFGIVDNDIIDKINILQASLLAMEIAYGNLCNVNKEITNSNNKYFALIDGNKNININIPSFSVVKGDDLSYTIGCASILAKVHRDGIMEKLHNHYPQYMWNKNMGYGTKDHLIALESHGINKYHRKSFAPIFRLLSS